MSADRLKGGRRAVWQEGIGGGDGWGYSGRAWLLETSRSMQSVSVYGLRWRVASGPLTAGFYCGVANLNST